MAFNFGSVVANSNGVASVRRQLKPWDIYKVKFTEAKLDELKGTKDPDAVYKTLLVTFENDEGYYSERIFFPKSGDEVRPTYENKDGHTMERASNVERIEAFMAQVAAVLNPDGFKKMQVAAPKFKNFDEVAKFFVAILDKVKGTETNLKLIGKANKDGQVNAALPYFVNVNRNGDVYISDNFIGDKLFFSTYEETQRQKYLNTKPTQMKSDDVLDTVTEDTTDDDNSDLTDLLAEL